MQGWERVIYTLSVRRPQPHNTNLETGRREGKIVEDYSRDRAASANKKAFALLLKSTSSTPSNTGSARLFQRDTERRTKVLW